MYRVSIIIWLLEVLICSYSITVTAIFLLKLQKGGTVYSHKQTQHSCANCEVLTVVLLKGQVLWEVMP